MVSPGGNSSGSSSFQNCDEIDLNHGMDQRKRKRMLSNRESARRSRMRKQNHLDNLMTQLSQLGAQNNQLLANIDVVRQLGVSVESENSVLVAQMSELNQRLQALNDIISCMNSNTVSTAAGFENDPDYGDFDYDQMNGGDDFLNAWGLVHVNKPIMASADAFMY